MGRGGPKATLDGTPSDLTVGPFRSLSPVRFAGRPPHLGHHNVNERPFPAPGKVWSLTVKDLTDGSPRVRTCTAAIEVTRQLLSRSFHAKSQIGLVKAS